MRTLGTSHPINLENLNSLGRAINSPVKIKDRACNKENKIFHFFFFMINITVFNLLFTGAPNKDIVQNHLT